MRIWLRFLTLLKPYRRRLFATFLATLARPLLNAAKIYLLKLIVDDLVRHPTGNLVLIISGGYLAIAVAKGIANYVDQYFGAFVGGRVVIDLRQQLFLRFLRLSQRYHNSHRVGESISRLISDVGAVEDLLVSGITDGATQVLTIIIFAAMLFYLDPLLALVSLTILPLLFASLVIYARRTRNASREVRVQLAELTSAAEEPFSAIALVKSFMRQDYEAQRLYERGVRHWNARMKAARQRAVFAPMSDIVATIGTILVVYFGAQALASGTLTIGGLVIFLAYLGQLYNPLLSLSRLGNAMQAGLAAAERVAGLLDLPASDDEPQAATRPWRVTWRVMSREVNTPAIAFEHVSFAYAPGQPVLQDFSLTVPQGAIVALVGASGGGKSTAVALLQRFYEPDTGNIRIFGHDLREFETKALRKWMAVVPQEVSLLMGSIRDNIAYGRLDATEQDILRVVQQTGIADMKLADGLNTMIGPRGAKLSGGQRQRVAIARALVRAAPILIFDEATSALDTLSEERLRLTLEGLRSQHTILFVAHRLSTVRSADVIAVVEQGHIIETGNHEELLKRNGAYAALVQGQQQTDIAKQTTAILPRL
ncbi:MAG: SAV1866 family putative multidrug efflux ABC transporter [Ktedonobacteraceae bacterium]